MKSPLALSLPTLWAFCTLCVWEVIGQAARPAFLLPANPSAPRATRCNDTVACRIPAIGDLILGRTVYASNTCGTSGAQRFCTSSPSSSSNAEEQEVVQCGTCDASDPKLRHTSDLLIDRQAGLAEEDWTWWQSENGVDEVELRLDLGAVYHLSHVTLTWKSERPRCMVVDRSVDFGMTWHLYQHFGVSCQECFGVPEIFGGVPLDQRGDSEFFPLGCTTLYSPGSTAIGREVGFVPLDALFADERTNPYSPIVQNVRKLTNLRIRFTKLQTQSAGMDANDSAVADRQHYAVFNLIVKGSCFCNGHADLCSAKNGDAATESPVPGRNPVVSECMCHHFTEGDDCSRCEPLYNDMPWQAGQLDKPNPCKPCECNGFASMCRFDEDRLLETNGTSGGICADCTHQRLGPNCAECVDGYFMSPSSSVKDPNACKVCACYDAGSESGLCTKSGEDAGVCQCKANVAGLACSTCKPDYYGLSANNANGCLDCDCDTNGTIGGSSSCDQATGQCQCKENVVGRRCDQCKDGYSELSAEDPLGCGSCMCDVGGSTSTQCDPDTRQCPCRPNMLGRRCDQLADGFFYQGLPHLSAHPAARGTWSPDGSLVANSDEPPSHNVVRLPAGSNMSILIRDVKWTMPYTVLIVHSATGSVTGSTNIHVKISPVIVDASGDGSGGDSGSGRDDGSGSDGGSGGPTTQASSVDGGSSADAGIATCSLLPDGTDGLVQALSWADSTMFDQRVCLQKGSNYRVDISHAGAMSSNATLLVDSIILLPLGSSVFRGIINDMIRDGCSAMHSASRHEPDSEVCAAHEFSLSAIFNNGALACDCNADRSNGTLCNQYNGQCDCSPGAAGRQCNLCRPYHYLRGTSCEECMCHSSGSEHAQCALAGGQCPCLANTLGRTCDQCEEDHFPYRSLAQGVGCLACECDGTGSLGSQCRADPGKPGRPKCDCQPGVAGAHCDQCMPGYWNFTSAGCEPCNCNPAGAVGRECNLETGTCMPKLNVMGDKADECKVGYMFLQAANPDGCVKCFGNGRAVDCRPAEDFYAATVESTLSASDGDGWSVAFDPLLAEEVNSQTIAAQPGASVDVMAPMKFLGDVRTAFTQLLTLSVDGIVPSSSMVVIKLQRNTAPQQELYYAVPAEDISNSEISIRLLRHGWRVSSLMGDEATDGQLRQALAGLSELTIQVLVAEDADETQNLTLNHVSLAYAERRNESDASNSSMVNESDASNSSMVNESDASNSSMMNESDASSSSMMNESDASSSSMMAAWVEEVDCTSAYMGQYCQDCAPGYTREPSFGGEFDVCLPCFDLCTLLSSEHCDPQSGVCRGCMNNTAGDYCQLCDPFYYRVHIFEGCNECPCPGNGRQFAPGCTADMDTGKAVCSCDEGHTGPDCTECSVGFHGQAAMTGESCAECSCNNNTDPTVSDFCDRQTGECLDCLYDTGGATCGRCADGYYGDALNRSCDPCDCNLDGAESGVCDYVTGQCMCRENVMGRRCDVCSPDHYGLSGGMGCHACNCCATASVSTQCDQDTGKCQCLNGVEGDKCCSCLDQFWGFPAAEDADAVNTTGGCQACECSMGGSTSAVCEKVSGACPCKPTSTGDKCDKCSAGTYGPPDCHDCGQCFLNWNASMADVSQEIREMGSRVRILRERGATGQYNETFMKIEEELEMSRQFLDRSYTDLTLLEDIQQGLKSLEYNIQLLNQDHRHNITELVDEVLELQVSLQEANNETFERVMTTLDSMEMRTHVIMPPEVVDLQRTRSALMSSDALLERAQQLAPASPDGQSFDETLRLLDEINTTLSSAAYKALTKRSSELLDSIRGRDNDTLEVLAALDRMLCGSDSRMLTDACPQGSSCGGIRCLKCLAGANSTCNRTAEYSANQATRLAQNTLGAVTRRSLRIQSLTDSVAALNRSAAPQGVRSEAVRDNAAALESRASAVEMPAVQLLATLRSLLMETESDRAAMQSALAALHEDLMSADNSTVMMSLVSAINESLQGIRQAEVDEILSDTESTLELAELALTAASASNGDAELALLDALLMARHLQQAIILQDEAVNLLAMLNATENNVLDNQNKSRVRLAQADELLSNALLNLDEAQAVMNVLNVTQHQITAGLDEATQDHSIVDGRAQELTQNANSLESQTRDLLTSLDTQEARLNEALSEAVDLFGDVTAVRKEIDEYRLRAETVYNATMENRRRLREIDQGMVAVSDDLDAAVRSIDAKDKLQVSCQFPAAP